MGELYDGPIIDAHHHFWDFDMARHGWLQAMPPTSPDAGLRRSHLPADYVPMAQRNGIVASVHVEANWDPNDPVGETRWLDGLERPEGIAGRYVAYAKLGEKDAAAVIEQHAAHPRVVGLREIVSWHPDKAKRREPANDRFGDPVWTGNIRRAGRLGLGFELLMTPHQFAEAGRLADANPDMQFIINHCGSPMDRDVAGMAFWRAGLRDLARRPNMAIKVSDPVAYDFDWTRESLTEVIRTVIEAFGPERSMFATDYPVADLHIAFDAWVAVFRAAVSPLSAAEQRLVFHDTAQRLYRF